MNKQEPGECNAPFWYIEEHFEFQKEFQFRLFQTSERQSRLHCHTCLELNLVEKGRGSYIIDGRVYPIEPGDIFVINNSEQHLAIHGEEELTMTVLVFDADSLWKNRYGTDYLKPFLNRNGAFSNRITAEAAEYLAMVHAFACMKQECVQEKTGWQMVTEAAANLLLSLLYQYYSEKQELKDTDNGQYMFGRITQVFTYIKEHFAENITLEQLSEVTALSKNYLCKYFKDRTGQTLFGYIEQTRVQYACYLLQTTDKEIGQIAMETGFESISYFNRIFKKQCNVTPGQFRKGIRQEIENKEAGKA